MSAPLKIHTDEHDDLFLGVLDEDDAEYQMFLGPEDAHLWRAYEEACRAQSEARRAVMAALRRPTAAEIEAVRRTPDEHAKRADVRRASRSAGGRYEQPRTIDHRSRPGAVLAVTQAQLDAMANDGRLSRLAMQMAIDAGNDWPSLDGDEQDAWAERAIRQIRSGHIKPLARE
jgi:hypothetical protein